MKSRFSLLLLLLFLSCGQEQKQPFSNDKGEHANNYIETPALPKVDTVYTDFPGKEKFSNLVAFGMTVQEWNKFIAQQAKEGVFEEIDNKGEQGSYEAFNRKNQGRQVSLSLEAKFLEPITKVGSKCEIVRINNIVPSQSILKEIDLEYNTSDPNSVNQIVNEFIANHNLSFIAGNDPMVADDRPATIRDYEFENEFKKKMGNENLANTQKWESQKAYTESVFENKIFYTILKIEEIKHNQLTRDYNGDIAAIEEGSKNFSIKIRACSKTFSDIDINQFRTYQQQEEIKSRKRSDELIDKALSN